MPDSQHSSPENPPIPTESPVEPIAPPPTEGLTQSPTAAPQPLEATPETKGRPVARPFPSSPMERARLESQGHIPPRNPMEERSTMVAFGLLFVLPLFIILFAMLLLLPFINSQLNQDPNPGGATVQSSPNQLPPTR